MAFLGAALLFSESLPDIYKSFSYGLSLSIKSLIVFLLPFVVFGLLFKTAVQFSLKASGLILLILLSICVSNFISTLTAYGIGGIAYGFDVALPFPKEGALLAPSFELSFPKWVSNAQAMALALLSGLILSKLAPAMALKISSKLERGVSYCLKGITTLIPFLIFGFIVKMNHDQVMQSMLQSYSLIFLWVAAALLSYLLFLYSFANGFNLKRALICLKNILPAAATGFGAMSSAAAMPLTILGAEKNAKDKSLAASFIPATVNIHLIGDCFAIPIFAFAILKSFGLPEPSLSSYLIFASYFVLAKFSVAAVPGGGILVMLPILEAYLGFNTEMLTLITALYLLFDPVITAANILGNGAFALILEKLTAAKPKTVPLEE
jgi:Na+/H+-dicarboxylate symporter